MTLKDILRVALLCLFTQKMSFRWTNVASAQLRNLIYKNPMAYYTATELACSEGYPAQEHKVITDDGYVLTVHRIPTGRTRAKIPQRKTHYQKLHRSHHPDFDDCVLESLNVAVKGVPVLFVHGLFMISDGWLLNGPGYDLAYIMADGGYDVWLANIRGNYYSRKHVTLSPSDPKFWNFSFHENAVYDIPATIDYILKVTKRDKIGYVGLSMGTTIFFIMTSLRPEYNEKILGSAALSPAAYIKLQHMRPIRNSLYNAALKILNRLEKRGNIHEMFPRKNTLEAVCKEYSFKTKAHLFASRMPGGTSLKTLLHYFQNMKGNCFKAYDYGREKNEEFYGSPTPPDYPLWNITAPIGLYYSKTDSLVNFRDIQDLMKDLPNVIDVYDKNTFSHPDFLWSNRAKYFVYPKVMSFFEKLADHYYF